VAKARTREPILEKTEQPISRPGSNAAPGWGSDAIADVLRQFEIPYVAVVPGSSFRGLEDSIVNFLGNVRPKMLVCLHEEHCVSIAHGYSKITETAMAAALHSNVGLMHASMAVFNAWCDRIPMLLLGANGPVDASKRRPWIDWVHSARDMGALVRGYVKWDEQPGSVRAAVEATTRAIRLANSQPRAPVYICYDVSDQEIPVEPIPSVDARRAQPSPTPAPAAELVQQAAAMLRAAKRPVFLMGRVSRSEEDWKQRIRLAEMFDAKVIQDIKAACSFPTLHPNSVGFPDGFLQEEQKEAIRRADVIFNMDWIDFAGVLKQSLGSLEDVKANIISASLDHELTNAWSYDHYGLAPVDIELRTSPDAACNALLEQGKSGSAKSPGGAKPRTVEPPDTAGPLTVKTLAYAVGKELVGRDVTYACFPINWSAQYTPFNHPLDYVGSDVGGGLGSGPGLGVGAALALKDSQRLPVAILGDGDFIMGMSGIWTAVHYGLPLLVIVANNQSYFNDEIHQKRVAGNRGRPTENHWIGQRLTDPDVDITAGARTFGAETGAPVEKFADLGPALRHAISRVDAGKVYVLDVKILRQFEEYLPPSSYDKESGKSA
jgi:thiamine pyrophosphate-dependent acetolactate synthase large subunit-like protein